MTEEYEELDELDKQITGLELCEIMSETCTFLGGIFFASLLLLLQFRDQFPLNVQILGFQFPMPLEILALSFTFSLAMFLFAALGYARASATITGPKKRQKELELIEELEDRSVNLFFLGIISTFVSLFLLLLIVSFWVALGGSLIILVAFIYIIQP